MKKIMHSLELFSGLKSVSLICADNGFIAHTLDNNPKLQPSICCDILNFDYSTLISEISFIWASPDCKFFSRLAKNDQWKKTILKYRQYHYEPLTINTHKALLYVTKTIEIIDHYKPALWIIENPVGRLRHIPELCRFAPYRYCVNYKDWGFPYSKETDLYTNQLFCFSSKKVQRFNSPGLSSLSSQVRACVPGQLIQFIIDCAIWP
jgi:hypothetical protein